MQPAAPINNLPFVQFEEPAGESLTVPFACHCQCGLATDFSVRFGRGHIQRWTQPVLGPSVFPYTMRRPLSVLWVAREGGRDPANVR